MAGRPPIGGGKIGPGMLGDELRDRLDASAERHGESRFAALRRLLAAALDAEDDRHRSVSTSAVDTSPGRR